MTGSALFFCFPQIIRKFLSLLSNAFPSSNWYNIGITFRKLVPI